VRSLLYASAMSRSCSVGLLLFVALVASSCSHDKPSDGASGSGSTAAAPHAERKPQARGHWSAHRLADGWCPTTPDALCAAEVWNCNRYDPLGIPCPPEAPDNFEIAQVDSDKCMIDPSRKEVPCPNVRSVIHSWIVHREGKACWTDGSSAAQIDCPPDDARKIVEIRPGVCETAQIGRETPDFKSKPVPCPPRS
jgi:hypothetical protein